MNVIIVCIINTLDILCPQGKCKSHALKDFYRGGVIACNLYIYAIVSLH